MPIFGKKKYDPMSSDARASATSEVIANYPLRPLVPPSVSCGHIRNAIAAVFSFRTFGYRLMEAAPPLNSDGSAAQLMRETGMPLTVSYPETLPAWPSWVSLLRKGDPLLMQIDHERDIEYNEMFSSFQTLVSSRVGADSPELERVQITSEFTCGSTINCIDAEDYGLTYYLAGDYPKFREVADRLRRSTANSKWAKAQLRDALLNLKSSRPDQFSLLAIHSADYISIGGIEFANQIEKSTTCPSCWKPVDDPNDRFCENCGSRL